MADTTLPALLGTGDHASRPAAGDVGSGALYACSDHDLIYQSDGSSWTTWSDVSGGGGTSEFTEIDTLKLTGGGADINTNSTSFTDLTGASITQTTAAVRCLVIVSLMAVNSNAGVSTCFDVDIDGTRFGNTTNGIARMVGTSWTPIQFSFFTDVLSAASHTFKIQWRVSANTGGVANQTTTSPIIFQVIETSLAV